MNTPLFASAKAMTFVVTRDRAVASQFYGHTLGFKQVSDDRFATVFDLNGTLLRISTVPDFKPQPHTVLGWAVPDILATVKRLKDQAINCTIYEGFGQDEWGIWTAPGSSTRVAWFLDPDGNNLSVTQF